MVNSMFWLKVLADILTRLTYNMDLFSWIDFFLDPFHIFMFGIGMGIFAWFLTGGVLYTFGVNRRLGIKTMIVVTVLAILVGWGMWIAMVIWYNTPMGPSLELK